MIYLTIILVPYVVIPLLILTLIVLMCALAINGAHVFDFESAKQEHDKAHCSYEKPTFIVGRGEIK
jgi:hypothetical protein